MRSGVDSIAQSGQIATDAAPLRIGLENSFGVEKNRYRPGVDKRDLHLRLKSTGYDRCTEFLSRLHHRFNEWGGLLCGTGFHIGWTPSMTGVTK